MNMRVLLIVFGLVNLSLLVFFTPLGDGDLVARQDRTFFGPVMLVMIALWGLAYMAAAPLWAGLPWLMLVFALEKMLFGARWLWWIQAEGKAAPLDLWHADPLAGLLFLVYGPWDIFCAGAFLAMAWVGFRRGVGR